MSRRFYLQSQLWCEDVCWTGRRNLPKLALFITFDDGWCKNPLKCVSGVVPVSNGCEMSEIFVFKCHGNMYLDVRASVF